MLTVGLFTILGLRVGQIYYGILLNVQKTIKLIKIHNDQETNHHNIRNNIKLTNKNTDLRQFNFVSQLRGDNNKKTLDDSI